MKETLILQTLVVTVICSCFLMMGCQADGPETEPPELPAEPKETSEPSEPEEFCGTSTMDSCETDSDCRAGGCSGQVCESADSEGMITTCEYKECYNAEKYGLECGCVEGACQWASKDKGSEIEGKNISLSSEEE